MRWCRRCKPYRRYSGEHRAPGPVSGSHSRPQSAAEEFPRHRTGAQRGRLQPAVRGSRHRLSEGRRWRGYGRELPGCGLCDFQGVGLADDGSHQGKDGRRGEGALRALSADDHGTRRSTYRRSRQAERAGRRASISDPGEMRQPGVAHAALGGRRAGRCRVDGMKQLPVVQPSSEARPAADSADQKTVAMVNDAERSAALKPQIVKAISAVYDPEIPVNIYDLGLIYDIIVEASSAVGVRMTL